MRPPAAALSSELREAKNTGGGSARYNLFASNVILASISFVYFPTDKWPATVINISTLLGSVIGQLSFGYFADRWGSHEALRHRARSRHRLHHRRRHEQHRHR